jgi:adenosine deaminase
MIPTTASAPRQRGADLAARLDFRRLPKVLLHEHLDGGLRPATVVELAEEAGYRALPTRDPGELEPWFQRGAQQGNLERYLEGFRHTCAVMQTEQALERAAFEFMEDMSEDGGLFYRAGFRVCLNTDDRLMSGTSMSQETALAAELFDLGLDDLEKLALNAMKSAFAPFEVRLQIIQEVIKPGYAAARAELGGTTQGM